MSLGPSIDLLWQCFGIGDYNYMQTGEKTPKSVILKRVWKPHFSTGETSNTILVRGLGNGDHRMTSKHGGNTPDNISVWEKNQTRYQHWGRIEYRMNTEETSNVISARKNIRMTSQDEKHIECYLGTVEMWNATLAREKHQNVISDQYRHRMSSQHGRNVECHLNTGKNRITSQHEKYIECLLSIGETSNGVSAREKHRMPH